MDSFESQIDGHLRRLREMRAKQCCKHIDQQMDLWVQNQDDGSSTNNTDNINNAKADKRSVECFLTNLNHLESFDSDATDSSSDDSFDELENFHLGDILPKRPRQPMIPTNSSDLKKKAIWKWAKDRSKLAARWTWLQAQIADLSFRIRGQNEALMLARASKKPPIPPFNPEYSCSRTVPLSSEFRKRRLIKSSKILSDSNKKSVRFSDVSCVCSSLPQTNAPCLSCNGRYNYLKRLDGENAPLLERASLLDPGCHSVLSLPDDITLGSQIAYLLKQETINSRPPKKNKPGRKKTKQTNKTTSQDNDKNAATDKQGKYYHGMSTASLKNPSQTMIASNKLKRKYRKQPNSINHFSWLSQTDASTTTATSNQSKQFKNKRSKRIRSASSMNDGSMGSDNSNSFRPVRARRRRSEQNAYDIDNIVIPLSVVATTRVEILEYKEIVTPSWRIHEDKPSETNDKNNSTNDTDEVEDTSDEVYARRHTKGECEEKKRFSLKPPKKENDDNISMEPASCMT